MNAALPARTGAPDARVIDALLRTEVLAHLACVMPDGRPYVVLITYAYDGEALYSYTGDGQKLRALRVNPSVCVAINRVEDAANWVSAVVWGTFRALTGEEAANALSLISTRLRTVAAADAASPAAEHTHVARTGRDDVAYRIVHGERSGR